MTTTLAAVGVGGSPLSPRRFPGLLAYYDPDDRTSLFDKDGNQVSGLGDTVARWMDRSRALPFYDFVAQDPGAANYATYDPSGVDGMPCVAFPGPSGGLQSLLYNVSLGGQSLISLTLMMVVAITHAANDTVCFVSAAKNGDNPALSPDGFLVQTPSDHLQLQFLKHSGGPGGINVSLAVDSAPALYTIIIDDADPGSGSGLGAFYVNGGAPSWGTDTSAGSAITLDAICFGARCDTLTQSMDYKARDIAIYSRRLGLAELDRLAAWMMTKIGAENALAPFEAP